MKDIPIIFSRPMIRALLLGRKCQTRRLLYHLKKVPITGISPGFEILTNWPPPGDFQFGRAYTLTNWHKIKPGDRLWTRENWRPDIADVDDVDRTIYQADIPTQTLEELRGAVKWRPSIHQPRKRSRITILVKDVKIQRCSDITDTDAIAEGARLLRLEDGRRVAPLRSGDGRPNRYTIDMGEGFGYDAPTPQGAFMRLWNALNGSDTWNQPVVAITGRVIIQNIDRIVI